MSSQASDVIKKAHEVAILAAREAGALITQNLGKTQAATKANENDLVTAIDKKCQEVIEARVKAEFPSHAFLGEESVPSGAGAAEKALEDLINQEWLWVIDPIDGTTNFIQGRPQCVVSIALACNGEVCLGVVYDPHRDEMFHAVRGRGAQINDELLRVSSETSLRSAVIGFGIGTTREVREPMLRGVQKVAEKCRGMRLVGSAALDLSWVACGRLTAWWEFDLNSWDVAAGALIVQEAGGCVTDTRGGAFSLRTRDIMASNGEKLQKELLAILLEENANAKLRL